MGDAAAYVSSGRLGCSPAGASSLRAAGFLMTIGPIRPAAWRPPRVGGVL